jgi:2-keto-4-pentenoate hydratase/2-oxohepta-3-ene-1,7-dioic acid hydratase in catechol pathway
VRLLAPISPMGKLIGIGINYKPETRSEVDGPGVFMRPQTSVIADGDPIVYPRSASRVVSEGELAVMIGKRGRRIPVADAMEYVVGYTCTNDVTVPTFVTRDDARFGINHKGKYYDSTYSVGPWLVTDLDPGSLPLRVTINSEIVKDAATSMMTWSVAECISAVSEIMTLYPGDLISTGCPGVDDLHVGDVVEIEIEGVGTIRNPVVADADSRDGL